MYGGGTGGGAVLGATTTVASAIVLPNTGENTLLSIAAIAGLVIGVAILMTTLARFVAKKYYKG